MTTYMVYGELKLKDATVCVVVGFICTLVGQVMMQALVAKYHRHSYIAYSIALVVGISAAAMTVESIMAMSHGKNQHGAGLCPLAH